MPSIPCQNARLASNSPTYKHTQLRDISLASVRTPEIVHTDAHTYPIYSVIMVIFSLVMVLHWFSSRLTRKKESQKSEHRM